MEGQAGTSLPATEPVFIQGWWYSQEWCRRAEKGGWGGAELLGKAAERRWAWADGRIQRVWVGAGAVLVWDREEHGGGGGGAAYR